MKKEIDRNQMSQLLEHELVLCIVKAHKNRSNSQLISNVITNLAFTCVETIPNKFALFLTKGYLYIRADEYQQFGGLERANNDEIIKIEDINSICTEEAGDNKLLKVSTDTEREFICNDDSEFEMAKVMTDLILGLIQDFSNYDQ